MFALEHVHGLDADAQSAEVVPSLVAEIPNLPQVQSHSVRVLVTLIGLPPFFNNLQCFRIPS